jgi:hypothetical protein
MECSQVKTAILIPGTRYSGAHIWTWFDDRENIISRDFPTREDALLSAPVGCVYLNDAHEPITSEVALARLEEECRR